MKHTHFLYVCRICKKEVLQPIDEDEPPLTPIPTCCSGRERDMAFKGVSAEAPYSHSGEDDFGHREREAALKVTAAEELDAVLHWRTGIEEAPTTACGRCEGAGKADYLIFNGVRVTSIKNAQMTLDDGRVLVPGELGKWVEKKDE